MDILQTIVWLIAIEFFLLGVTILFSHFHRNIFSFLVIAIMILLPSALLGGIIGAKMGDDIAPYIVYDQKRVQTENIKVVGFEDGKYVFSNGEKVRISDSFVLRINIGIGYLIGTAIIFFPGLYIAKRIARKSAPDVYNLLENKK